MKNASSMQAVRDVAKAAEVTQRKAVDDVVILKKKLATLDIIESGENEL